MKITAFIASLIFVATASADVTLYTDRPEARMQEVASRFTQATGINVKLVIQKTADVKALLAQEGLNSPADVIFVNDLANLTELARDGRFQPMPLNVANKVNGPMKDVNNLWTAVTYRARTLIYNSNIDSAIIDQINTYEDLANPELAGTLCLRTSKSSYNESLVAFLISTYGEARAKEIVAGWLDNRADTSFTYANDTAILNDLVTATPAGTKCAFGITNTYYVGLYLVQNPSAPLKIKFLNQNENGVHTNGTGAGISASSKNVAEAALFMDHLLSDGVQIYLTNDHQDYPAKAGLKAQNLSVNWGTFLIDPLSWTNVGENVEKSRQLMKDLNYL